MASTLPKTNPAEQLPRLDGPGLARQVLGSGWVPLAVVVLGFVGVVHISGAVRLGDATLFVGYLAIWVTLPGTVIWRLCDPRAERRHIGEDLAIGTLVGYVAEFPVYLACLALGHPHGYLLWPLVPIAVLVSPLGRGARHLGSGRLPTWWSWTAGAAALYLIAWFGQYAWRYNSMRLYAMRAPYKDEPYHLALATGLKHFFPPRVTYVADTPLDYHYLSHVHIAAASWVTGIEPVVLLRTLAVPALVIVVVVAAAFTVARLSGALWTGVVMLATVTLAPATFGGWGSGRGEGLLSIRLIASPSAGFVNAALLLGLLLCMELLTLGRRAYGAMALTFVVFVAMAGGKSTSLPTLLAGLTAATVISSIAARKVNVRALVLTLGAGLAFEVAKVMFFGPGSHGLAFNPLALATSRLAGDPGLAGPDGSMPFDVRVVVAATFLAYLTLGVATFTLLARRGWAKPSHVFLVTTWAAGIGAGLSFHQSSFSEFYFLYVVILPSMVAATLGIHHLVEGPAATRFVKPGLAALAAGAVGSWAFGKFTHAAHPQHLAGSPLHQAFRLFVVPEALWLLLIAFLTGAVLLGRWFLDHRLPAEPGTALLVVAVVFLGFGTAAFFRNAVPDILSDPIPRPAAATNPVVIGKGGIEAARWLRAHSSLDDVVATNVHCEATHSIHCTPRSFWIAAYAERQMLVEGWSYVSRWSIGEHPPADENMTVGPFWDPARLAANDAAIAHPTAANLAYLAQHYGVRWLFVDRLQPSDIAALKADTDVRFRNERYLIFKLR